jgi:hypothetical protein
MVMSINEHLVMVKLLVIMQNILGMIVWFNINEVLVMVKLLGEKFHLQSEAVK